MALIDVKRPVLLDSGLNESAILYPSKGSLTLHMTGVSECSLTLPVNSPEIGMHAWVKVFNQKGFVGIFRRTSAGKNFPNDQSVALRHGIDILQDSVWQAETEFSGTMTQFLTALLNQQTQLINGVKPWVLGTCADTTSLSGKKINYDNLLDLLEDLEDESGNFYFSYDQTTFPWTLNYLAKPSAVASEFRLSRNIERCKISENDSELCTRLILNVNALAEDETLGVKQNQSVMRIYNNTTAQALYGIVIKTVDIDTQDTLPNGPFPEADAYAAKFLADRASPVLQIQIDGYELSKITGDAWDESRIGTLCRVALPDYAAYASERVVMVSYPDFLGVPDRVSVSLANALPQATRSVASQQKAIARSAAGGRSSAREQTDFALHFQITDEDANILKQAGLYLNADGMLVYADDNVNMIGSRFNVQADKIGMVVGTNSQGNFIKAGEIALSINSTTGASTALIDANHVNISATDTAYTLAGEMERDANGRLIIKSAGGMYVEKTIGGVKSYFGVYDNNNLTGGVIVEKLNDSSTTTKIIGSKIQIGNETADVLIGGLREDVDDVDGRVETVEGSALWVNKDNITGVVGQMYKDANGKIHIQNGSGLQLDRDGSSFGVYDSGNLTGGVVAQKINGQSTVKIVANSIDIDGIVVALQSRQLTVGKITIGQEITGPLAGFTHLSATSLAVDGTGATWQTYSARRVGLSDLHGWMWRAGISSEPQTVNGRIVLSYSDTTLHYLGYSE